MLQNKEKDILAEKLYPGRVKGMVYYHTYTGEIREIHENGMMATAINNKVYNITKDSDWPFILKDKGPFAYYASVFSVNICNNDYFELPFGLNDPFSSVIDKTKKFYKNAYNIDLDILSTKEKACYQRKLALGATSYYDIRNWIAIKTAAGIKKAAVRISDHPCQPDKVVNHGIHFLVDIVISPNVTKTEGVKFKNKDYAEIWQIFVGRNYEESAKKLRSIVKTIFTSADELCEAIGGTTSYVMPFMGSNGIQVCDDNMEPKKKKKKKEIVQPAPAPSVPSFDDITLEDAMEGELKNSISIFTLDRYNGYVFRYDGDENTATAYDLEGNEVASNIPVMENRMTTHDIESMVLECVYHILKAREDRRILESICRKRGIL